MAENVDGGGLTGASHDQERSFALMQQLIEEMDRTNQRLDYMEDRMERPGVASQGNGLYSDLYDDAWRSEESDGASLQDVPITFPGGNNDASGHEDAVNSAIAEVSKDFLTGQPPPAKHNESEESQLSSDNDFKLITGMAYCARYPETAAGLSDTDWNPYGTESDNNASPHQDSSGQLSESKISWNPPLHSTDYNVITPFSNSTQPRAASIHDSRDGEVSTRPDITVDFSTISHVSDSDLLQSSSKVPRSIGDGYVASELNKTMRADTATTDTVRTGEHSQHASNLHEVNTVTGRMMSKESSVVSKAGEGFENSQYVSVVERARLMGIPQDILEGKRTTLNSGLYQDLSADTTRSADYASEEDALGQKVEHVLFKTEHLDGRHSEGSSGVDYGTLQRDLQEIQDSLHRTLGSNNSRRDGVVKKKSPPTSDSDIVPSTTTTPESQRRNKMAWDFAGDLGYGDADHLFREISLDTRTTGSQSQQRLSSDKHGLHSDGEETHTSEGSSSKHDHHAAADQALADMMEILHPPSTGTDVDQMLSNFRDQRRQLETRYEQLNNQGLADKVNRILNNQDPNSQANVILSEVSAEEKDMKTRYALGLGWKDFNVSGNSKPGVDESIGSLALSEDVRRRLNLSDVSSVDGSHLGDKPSFSMPSSKRFTAFDDMSNFLSSQMAKFSDRSFNRSVEMRIPPQHIQCYPMLQGDNGEGEGSERKDGDRKNGSQQNRDTESKRERTSEKESRNSSPPNPPSDPDNRNNSSADSQTDQTTQPREKYRPYRPAGSQEMYYTESDTASVADSVTTVESTHFGSDDAHGPSLPSSVLGSRGDVPSARGIYGNKRQAQGVGELPTIQERTSLGGDEKDSESSRSRESATSKAAIRGEGEGREVVSVRVRTELSDPGTRSSPPGKCSVEGMRREARWENRMEERERGRESPELQKESRGEKYSSGSREKIISQTNFIESEYSSSCGDNPLLDARYERDRRPYSLPSDAFVSSGEDAREAYGREESAEEPLSLRIKMTFDEDAPREVDVRDRPDMRRYERQNNRLEEEDNLRLQTHSEISTRARERQQQRSPPQELRARRSPSPELPRYTDILSDRRSRLDNFSYQPVSPKDSVPQASREARVSPAFHRALSPELRSAIESRSPILSGHIERSLAQPPGYQAVGDRSRPTFLARDRRHRESPEQRQHQQQQPASISSRTRAVRAESPVDRVPSPTYTRPLSPVNRARSPSLLSQGNLRPTTRTLPTEDLRFREMPREYDMAWSSKERTSRSPVPKRFVELTLEGMSSVNEPDQEVDKEPVSKRAQLLTQALAEEDRGSADPESINQAWEQFQAGEESQDSSMGSGRIGAVSDLLKNPTQQGVRNYLQERQQYQLERQDRAERDRLRQQMEHKQLQQLSHTNTEDEPSTLVTSQAEGAARLDADRQRKKNGKKKKGRSQGSSANRQTIVKAQVNNENVPDNLFSIAEDSYEHSPGKTPSKRSRSGDKQQQHVIDPNMRKLRDRIQQQRHKIDKGKLKELQRVERVRRLEDLLSLKKSGEIGDGTLQREMEEISNTSSPSQDSVEHTPFSDDSTTAKDSSTEMHRWKAEKERRIRESRVAERAGKDTRFSSGSRGSQARTKVSSEDEAHWELRILGLVRDGQLTPDEAYALAEGRAKEESGKDSSQDYAFSGKEERPHRRYKPYMRHQDDSYLRTKHVPKLCIPEDESNNNRNSKENRYSNLSSLGPGGADSYWTNHVRDHRREEQPAGMFHVSGSYRPRKEHSASPTRRGKSHSPMGRPLHSRTRSASPGSMSKHQPKRGHQYKAHHWIKKSDLYPDPPVRESIAWNIPYDQHPSQWKEPMLQGRVPESNNYQDSGYSKKDRISNKGGTLALEDLENVNPLAQRMRFPTEEHHNLENLLDQNKFDDGTNQMLPKHVPDSRVQPSIFDEEKGKGCPAGIPREEWSRVVSRDVLARKENHWEVDPLKDRVQYILNKPALSVQGKEPLEGSRRPQGSLTLQEAFLSKKQHFISHCKERQKRLALSKDNRQMQECLRLERDAIFPEPSKMAPPNLYAHPYSENLYQPKNRIMSKQEMKEMSRKKYNNLPEVLKKKENEVKAQESKLNRLRARLFNKKVQRDALKKLSMRQR